MTDPIFDNFISFKSSIPKIAYDFVYNGQARGLQHWELGLVEEEQDPVAAHQVLASSGIACDLDCNEQVRCFHHRAVAQVVEERDQVAEQVGVDDVDEEQQLVLDQVSSCLKNCQPGEI